MLALLVSKAEVERSGYVSSSAAGESRYPPHTGARPTWLAYLYQLQIKRRSTDDLEHVRGGGLCCQRLTQFVEQPCVLDSNDACAAKFVSNSICFSVKGCTSCR